MINFVVPDRMILQKQIDSENINCEKPGVLEKNVENFSTIKNAANKSYKICFDGKKIAPGFCKTFGKVDIFGYDSKPTSSERKAKLTDEIISITSIEVILGKAE